MRLSLSLRSLNAFILSSATVLAQAGELTVSAAASLTDAFKEIGLAFESQHPGTEAVFNFGASGALLQQLVRGAPVDVFASADEETMDRAQRQGLVLGSQRHDFARNSLVIVVPVDGPLELERLEDLAQTSVKRVAIGNPAIVPAGRYTRRALEARTLWSAVKAKMIGTQNVRQALDYVARGEVDAGFVYATDAAIMKDKVRIAFPVPIDVPILYPIARTANSANAEMAEQFVEFVLAPAAQAILRKYGFPKP